MKETSSQLRQLVISLQISTQVHKNALIVLQKPVGMSHNNMTVNTSWWLWS